MPFLNSGYTCETMLIVSVEAERINKRNAITYGRILKVLCQFFVIILEFSQDPRRDIATKQTDQSFDPDHAVTKVCGMKGFQDASTYRFPDTACVNVSDLFPPYELKVLAFVITQSEGVLCK